jgi:hypothetical protein
MPTAVQPNNSTTATSHVVQVTSSIGLLVGLVAIIIFAVWLSYRKRLPVAAIRFVPHFPVYQEPQQKYVRRYTLESIPVVSYNIGLQRDQDVGSKILTSDTGLSREPQTTLERGTSIDPEAEAEGETESVSCPVCTDDFVKGEKVRILPCGHIYHQDCIDPWLFERSGTCPLW